MYNDRQSHVDTLRGLAVLLMVAGHVIGDLPTTGLRVADDSTLRHFYVSLQFLRMPLFAVITGYVYAYRPLEPDKAGRFLANKLRRLLIPLFTVATAQYLCHVYMPA